MKITLDIDPTVLGTEVSEFIKTLTPEDKNALVKQVVTEYYTDFRKFEKGEQETKDKEFLQIARSKMSHYDKPMEMSDDAVRASYQYRDASKTFKTTSQLTREEISSSIRSKLQEEINKFIETDAEYQKLLKDSMDSVKERFPLMVQQAMVTHMAGQLPNVISQVYNMTDILHNRLVDVEQKLLR